MIFSSVHGVVFSLGRARPGARSARIWRDDLRRVAQQQDTEARLNQRLNIL